jgi:hypothetical protein
MPFGKWANRYLNAATLAVHGGFLLAVVLLFRSGTTTDIWFLFILVSLCLAAFAWMFNLRRMLAISENPTSSVAAAAQGYIELLGGACQILPLKSPLQGKSCVWFRYWVYVKDQNNVWRLADYRCSEDNFEIEDATGRCLIIPKGAEVIATSRHVIQQHDHKFIEEIIPNGKSVYVLGQLETITEVTAAREIKHEVGQLLAKWKKSSASFLQRFDLDRNGEVDMEEWEKARTHATNEVLLKKGIINKNEVHAIRAPDDGRMFLISGISPYQLRARYKFWIHVHLLVMAIAAILALLLSFSHWL